MQIIIMNINHANCNYHLHNKIQKLLQLPINPIKYYKIVYQNNYYYKINNIVQHVEKGFFVYLLIIMIQ
jgi:hypothetical protein